MYIHVRFHYVLLIHIEHKERYNISKLFAGWSVDCRVSIYGILCRLLSDRLWSFQLVGKKIAKFG